MKPLSTGGYWYPNLAWLMVQKPSATRGSHIWNRITATWKILARHIDVLPPPNADEVLNTSIWWSNRFMGTNFNFTSDRACILARSGLCTLGDFWNDFDRVFHSWEFISIKYPLLPI